LLTFGAFEDASKTDLPSFQGGVARLHINKREKLDYRAGVVTNAVFFACFPLPLRGRGIEEERRKIV
jgi:hypothetical protein